MAGSATRHVGLDLGGTNLKWVVAEHDGDAGWHVVDRGSVPTATAEGERTIVPQLAAVGAAAAAGSGARSVGIGVPGVYDPDAGMIVFLPNVPGTWDGVPVAGPVAAASGLPVALVNDARAFGLAELRLGAARGARSMVGLTLGTGIGGVIAIDGHVHQGWRGTAGELGHQTIDPDGPDCGCGNRGCLEAHARADRLAAACAAPTAEEAMRRAAAGDPAALRGLAAIGRALGIGLANAVVAITPDVIVLGGGVAASIDLLAGPIREELARRVRVTDIDRIRIVGAELGTWAGAIGAAVHGAERAAAGARR